MTLSSLVKEHKNLSLAVICVALLALLVFGLMYYARLLPPSFKRASDRFLVTFNFDVDGVAYSFQRPMECYSSGRSLKFLWMPNVYHYAPHSYTFKITPERFVIVAPPVGSVDWRCDTKVTATFARKDGLFPVAAVIGVDERDQVTVERYVNYGKPPVNKVSGGMLDYENMTVTVEPHPWWKFSIHVGNALMQQNQDVSPFVGFGGERRDHRRLMDEFYNLHGWKVPRSAWSKDDRVRVWMERFDGSGIVTPAIEDIPRGEISKRDWLRLPEPNWTRRYRTKYFPLSLDTRISFDPVELPVDIESGSAWRPRLDKAGVERYHESVVKCDHYPTDDRLHTSESCFGNWMRLKELDGSITILLNENEIEIAIRKILEVREFWLYDAGSGDIWVMRFSGRDFESRILASVRDRTWLRQ